VIGPRADVKGPTAAGKMDFHELGKPQMPWGTLQLDIDAARSFLVQRNNAGELNLSKLGLVGSEMGATMAIMWAFKDWSYPSQVGFSGKQGQDVQALVLISPTYNFKGVTVAKELPELQKMVPMQFVVGKKDPKAYGEAEKMFKAMKGRPTEANSQLTELKTNLQGSKLLNPELELDADKAILKFLDSTVKQKGTKWEARESSEGNAPAGQ
jgi:dienelactone hydrolase